MEGELNGLSEALLLSVKKEQPVDELVAQLEAAPFERLVSELDSDQRKIAFWVNCYNAYFQILCKEQGLEKPQIYRLKKINIAGRATGALRVLRCCSGASPMALTLGRRPAHQLPVV